MSENDREDQDDEPVQENRGCPMGIPMNLLAKMSQEDIDEWMNWDPAAEAAQKLKYPGSHPGTEHVPAQ